MIFRFDLNYVSVKLTKSCIRPSFYKFLVFIAV